MRRCDYLGGTSQVIPHVTDEIKQGIKLLPESVLAADWVVSSSGSTGSELVLDPTYAQAPSQELDKRILAHLGTPDITERVFAPVEAASSPVALDDEGLLVLGLDEPHRRVEPVGDAGEVGPGVVVEQVAPDTG